MLLRFWRPSLIGAAGRQIVELVLSAMPEDWRVVVLLDLSGGFWLRIAYAQDLKCARAGSSTRDTSVGGPYSGAGAAARDADYVEAPVSPPGKAKSAKLANADALTGSGPRRPVRTRRNPCPRASARYPAFAGLRTTVSSTEPLRHQGFRGFRGSRTIRDSLAGVVPIALLAPLDLTAIQQRL